MSQKEVPSGCGALAMVLPAQSGIRYTAMRTPVLIRSYSPLSDLGGCASSLSGTVTVTESGVTSVGSLEKKNTMVAFPNPAQEVLYMAFSLEKPGEARYYLADLLGRPVLQGRAALSGQETLELSLAELPAGAYLLVVDINGQLMEQRIVKSR